MSTTVKPETEPPRCPWCLGDELYIAYHDSEWGVPVHDDRRHFEFLLLEGAQAGLSWLTVLRKREGYRRAFADFDPQRVAELTDADLEALRQNPQIVRNRLKIAAARTNAQAFIAVVREFGSFDRYVWGFVGGAPMINRPESLAEGPATTPESDALSKDLKARGFSFVGSTIIYAQMQATGLVNDHITSCYRCPAE